MKTETVENTLQVIGLERLSGTNSAYFKELVRAQLKEHHQVVEVDCGSISFIDSEGLGALVSIYKHIKPRDGVVRLLSLRPMVREFLELVQLQRIFEMVP